VDSGQAGAVVGAGAGDTAGVHVANAHKLWLRDLNVSGGTVGVVAEQASELHVTRCVVKDNGKGGIKTTDSGFDITSTIITGNSSGTDTGGVVAGARLGNVPQNLLGSHLPVVDNKPSSATTPYAVSTNIVHANTGGEARTA
jgi:hypothetical protein